MMKKRLETMGLAALLSLGSAGCFDLRNLADEDATGTDLGTTSPDEQITQMTGDTARSSDDGTVGDMMATGDEETGCAGLDETQCEARKDCMTIEATAEGQWSPSFIGCMEASDCGTVMSYAVGDDGTCYQFGSSCIPEGFHFDEGCNAGVFSFDHPCWEIMDEASCAGDCMPVYGRKPCQDAAGFLACTDTHEDGISYGLKDGECYELFMPYVPVMDIGFEMDPACNAATIEDAACDDLCADPDTRLHALFEHDLTSKEACSDLVIGASGYLPACGVENSLILRAEGLVAEAGTGTFSRAFVLPSPAVDIQASVGEFLSAQFCSGMLDPVVPVISRTYAPQSGTVLITIDATTTPRTGSVTYDDLVLVDEASGDSVGLSHLSFEFNITDL